MLPSRYLAPMPASIKKRPSQLQHLSAPLKGLSLDSKLTEGDPLTAPILDNWVVDEDKIRVRPGAKLVHTLPNATPISAIVPFDGLPENHLLASDFKLYLPDNSILYSGLTSDDWDWTAFSNLGAQDFTVMVNGKEGVSSWDGGNRLDSLPIPITAISKANPAVVTVGAADIGNFFDGMNVQINGFTGDFAVANGNQIISFTGVPPNSFSLLAVNTSTATGTYTSGAVAKAMGSFLHENVTAPAGETWIDVSKFDKVLSHMNRLWFADSKNLAIYYLPIQQKSGLLKFLPFNAIFRHGGEIAAIASWTMDGGRGMEDVLCIFTTHGECAIYSGTDPDSDFSLTGIFHFDSPMSKHSLCQYGGDLYVLTATGVYAMSGLLKARTAQSDKTDKKVVSAFLDIARDHRGDFGWQLVLDHHTGMLLSNLPEGGARYKQMLRFMPNPIWASWSGLKARCWTWLHDNLYFASDDGKMYQVAKAHQSDDGQPILADVQFAWSSYKTPALKQFKMLLPYIISDGFARPYLDCKVDYDQAVPQNWPEVSAGVVGAVWDEAIWDVDFWAASPSQRGQWQGVGRLGRVGAPRLRVAVLDCSFSVAAIDVIYEPGAAL